METLNFARKYRCFHPSSHNLTSSSGSSSSSSGCNDHYSYIKTGRESEVPVTDRLNTSFKMQEKQNRNV